MYFHCDSKYSKIINEIMFMKLNMLFVICYPIYLSTKIYFLRTRYKIDLMFNAFFCLQENLYIQIIILIFNKFYYFFCLLTIIYFMYQLVFLYYIFVLLCIFYILHILYFYIL